MAVNLSPVGGAAAQFFDNSGNVLTGGLLYSYLAGTTTPAVTYTQSNGITANSNPIVLDAAGRVPNSGEIWLTDGISYKFVLQDQNSVQIATWDNIVGINSNFIAYTSQTETQTATQGQTIFTLTSIQYQPTTDNLAVFVNGSKQVLGLNYQETSSTVVTFIDGLNVGDVVEFNTASPVSSSSTTAANVSYNEGGTGAVNRTVEAKLQEFVSVLDFDADPTGVVDATTAFNNAAAVGTTVYVPKGDYLIGSTTNAAFWYLQEGSYIDGLPDINNVNDTSRLTGRIFNIENDSNGTGIRVGDSNPWIEDVRFATEAIAEMAIVSSTGQIGLVTGSRTSDNLTANYAGIGLAAYGINDNTTNPEPAWATYFEARRSAGAGAAYCSEMDMVNTGSTFDMTPFTSVSPTTGQTSNLWISNGGGDVALGGNPNSAAITILPNPATFKRGIVFRYGSLDGTTNEAITLPVGYSTAWYNNSDVLNSYIDHRNISLKTEVSSALGNVYTSTKWRDSGAATVDLDSVNRHNFVACSGSSTNYAAGFTQCLQRSNFSASNARFSYDIQVKNSDGTNSEVTLNGVTEKAFTPATDNFLTLGSSSFRWSVVYAATGTISTSDERNKQDIKDLSELERQVAIAIKGLIKSFRFKDAVEQKGNRARIHFGVMAQQVAEAFKIVGLNPDDYGLFCYDEWEASENVEAGDRYGIRYDELLAFVIAAL